MKLTSCEANFIGGGEYENACEGTAYQSGDDAA